MIYEVTESIRRKFGEKKMIELVCNKDINQLKLLAKDYG